MNRILKWTVLSFLILVVTLFSTLLMASGVFQTKQYHEPWSPKYYQNFSDVRKQLIAHGLLAANGHNMQAWKFVLSEEHEREMDLYVDTSRLSGAVDPDYRQLFISQGTLLEYMVIAGRVLGVQVQIEYFPHGELEETTIESEFASKAIARITLNDTLPTEEILYPYIFQPDTNRGGYDATRLNQTIIDALLSVHEGDEITMEFIQDEERCTMIRQYAMDAAVIETNQELLMSETDAIFRANESQKNQYRYGFSFEGQGKQGIGMHLLQGLITLFPGMAKGDSSKQAFLDSTVQSLAHTSSFLLIHTKETSRVNQIEAGRLYSKLILQGHHLGLAMQPLSQAIQVYDAMLPTYQAIHEVLEIDGTIYLLVRVGKPTQIAFPSMRMSVEQLIQEVQQ